MYLVENKFAFISNPRTGSRAVATVLAEQFGAKAVSTHHVEFDFLKKIKRLHPKLQIYMFTREPFSLLHSWYYLMSHKLTNPMPVDTELRRKLLGGFKDVADYEEHDCFQEGYDSLFRHFFLKRDPFHMQYDMSGYRLNCYATYCDHIFLYENGLDSFFKFLGKEVELPEIGVSKQKEPGLLSEQTKTEIRERFQADFKLYDEWYNKDSHRSP